MKVSQRATYFMPPESTPPISRRRSIHFHWRRYGLNALGVLMVAGVVWAAGVYGLRLRNALFTETPTIRFRADIENGYRWGGRVVTAAQIAAKAHPGSSDPVSWPQFFRAFVAFYDQFDEMPDDSNYVLDYSPSRLLVMSSWSKYVRETYPKSRIWRDEMTWPLLYLNTTLEIIGTFAMFAVVLLWKCRGGAGGWHATIIALIAALIFWFNPSTLLDAHTWPQWDVWLIPFFLLALLLASLDWFFCAGMLIAVGATLKGQMLMGGAPILVLWPLLGGRFGATMRAVIGFFAAASLFASPWLVPNEAAWRFVRDAFCTSVISIVALFLVQRIMRSVRRRWSWDLFVAMAVLGLVLLWRTLQSAMPTESLVFIGAASLVAAALLPKRALPFWSAAIFCCAVYLSSELFDGSWAWFKIGYIYPTRHYEALFLGETSNLAAILARSYGWTLFSPVTLPISWNNEPLVLPMKMFLPCIYGMTVVLCAIGAVIHSRRSDPRTLVALTAPWVLLFALLPKMHERYLMWAAAVCGVGLATSVGLGLLHLVVVGLSTVMILQTLLEREAGNGSWPILLDALQGTHPGIAWMTVLLSLVYLYQALRITPRRASKPLRHGIDFI